MPPLTPPSPRQPATIPAELELTDADILDALTQIPGYIDISTEDFRTVYHLAWCHAVARLRAERERSDDGDA